MNLENIVVGQFNELAFKTAEIIIQAPGNRYPLFHLYAPAGLGKTTILKIIFDRLERENSIKFNTGLNLVTDSVSITFKSGLTLATEFISSIKDHCSNKYTAALIEADILIIDDFQFLNNMSSTQQMLHNVIKNRLENNRQTIIASTNLFHNMKGISKDLKGLFSNALTVAIQKPELEDRISIVRHLCKNMDLYLNDDSINLIAKMCTKSINQINGVLQKLELLHSTQEDEITLEIVKKEMSLLSNDDIEVQNIKPIKSEKLYLQAVIYVSTLDSVTPTLLENKFHISSRAAQKLLAQMEKNSLVGSPSGERKVLIKVDLSKYELDPAASYDLAEEIKYFITPSLVKSSKDS